MIQTATIRWRCPNDTIVDVACAEIEQTIDKLNKRIEELEKELDKFIYCNETRMYAKLD